MKPFFTIIIPTYNRASTISKPIDSMISQTFTDWELIIVDDGSTDATKEIIETYKEPRIRYVWQENQERSAARNHGISLAMGEWICFQDSDDEYLPNHLAILKSGIEKFQNYDVFRTGLLLYKDNKLFSKPPFRSLGKYDQYPYEFFQSYCFRKTLLNNYQFDKSFFIGEDFHFLVRICSLCKLKILESYTGIYNYDPINNAGFGENYEKNMSNKILCLNDLLQKKIMIMKPFIIRQICLSHIIMLRGHISKNKRKIPEGLLKNILCFFRYPYEYYKLTARISFVKTAEITSNFEGMHRF